MELSGQTSLDLTKGYYQVAIEQAEQGQDSICSAFWKIPIPDYAIWLNLSTFNLPKDNG